MAANDSEAARKLTASESMSGMALVRGLATRKALHLGDQRGVRTPIGRADANVGTRFHTAVPRDRAAVGAERGVSAVPL